jgi:hypothetical protein
MATREVLCPHCLERNAATFRKNFYAMPQYRCPACDASFLYPASKGVLVVAGVIAVLSLASFGWQLWALLDPSSMPKVNPMALALAVTMAIGSVGALVLSAGARRRVADAELRATYRSRER